MPDIVEKALHCLGRGFDITSDFRMKYCKGKRRLVSLNEADTRDLLVPGFGLFPGVSVDIKCDKGERIRYQSDVLQFHQAPQKINSVENSFPCNSMESTCIWNRGDFSSIFYFSSFLVK